MGEFRFKEFSVSNNISAMKVNTDGVILGAYSYIDSEYKDVLDIGTGTGTIALMIAQRLSKITNNINIVGIDIDELAFSEAQQNFNKSPWKNILTAYHIDLKKFSQDFDLIISNPPFFENSLTCVNNRKSIARHTESLSYIDILNFTKIHLRECGRLCIILPYNIHSNIIRYASSLSLHCSRFLTISSKESKNPYRCVLEFTKIACPTIEDKLYIHCGNNYSKEYINLTKDFYINL